MASLDDLRQYILRQLGYPMHTIELTELQIDDAIDNAIERFCERHYNALMKNTYKLDLSSDQNDYILPENVRAVIDVMPASNILGMCDHSEKLLLPLPGAYTNYLWQFADLQSITTYRMTRQTFEKELRIAIKYDFNYPSHKFRILGSISNLMMRMNGNSVMLLVYESAEDISDIFKDRWFKVYASALAKRQWGVNLQKYSEIPLPGGSTLNADKIIDQADREIERLETQLEEEYDTPPEFEIG